MKLEDTDPFEVPMYETSFVEVLQTLGCVVQLLSYFSGRSDGR